MEIPVGEFRRLCRCGFFAPEEDVLGFAPVESKPSADVGIIDIEGAFFVSSLNISGGIENRASRKAI